MATADLDFSLKIKGTPDEIIALLKIMRQYSEGGEVYFSFTTVTIDGQAFRFSSGEENDEEIFAAARAAVNPVNITASGPYGRYGMLGDVDIFRDMAESAPSAEFFGVISGFAGYADQSLTARLADGKLHISTSYLSDDVRGEAELEYASTCLPYEEFIELFRLDGDEFDADMYQDFMSDEVSCKESPAEFFEETDYEEFIELIGVDCSLSEEEYEEIAQQLAETEYPSFEEFLEDNDYALREKFVYDPIEKKYIEADGMEMKSNTAYSINDTIREYLQSIGRPCDDEAIDALSVEDVYAILAGTYGNDD
ncbi:MAG: hypothetical protein IJP17_07080 [Clostridia bacterium]|nr:hypothetical protein [Clostridia bacterium]